MIISQNQLLKVPSNIPYKMVVVTIVNKIKINIILK
jgi:hypothetical protein